MRFSPLLVIIPILFLAGCTSEAPEKAETTATTIQTTTTTLQTELKLNVGETAKTSALEVTVLSANLVNEYEYYDDIFQEYRIQTAPEGKRFVLVEADIKNIGSDRAYVGASEFSISDSEGFRYDPSVLYYGSDGLEYFKELYQNQKMKGKILFEVPDIATGLKLSYDFGDIISGVKLATWEIG